MEKRHFGRIMSDKSENRFIIFDERLNQLIPTINSLAEEVRSIKSDRDDSLLAFHQVSASIGIHRRILPIPFR